MAVQADSPESPALGYGTRIPVFVPADAVFGEREHGSRRRGLERASERIPALEPSRDRLAVPEVNHLLPQSAPLNLSKRPAVSQDRLEENGGVLRKNGVAYIGTRLQLTTNLERYRASALEFDGGETQCLCFPCDAEKEEIAAGCICVCRRALGVKVNQHERAQGTSDRQGTAGFAAGTGLTTGGRRLSHTGQQRRRGHETPLRFLMSAHWLCSSSAMRSKPEAKAPDSQSSGISRTSEPPARLFGWNRHAPT